MQRGLQPSPSPGSASLVLAEAQPHLRALPRQCVTLQPLAQAAPQPVRPPPGPQPPLEQRQPLERVQPQVPAQRQPQGPVPPQAPAQQQPQELIQPRALAPVQATAVAAQCRSRAWCRPASLLPTAARAMQQSESDRLEPMSSQTSAARRGEHSANLYERPPVNQHAAAYQPAAADQWSRE